MTLFPMILNDIEDIRGHLPVAGLVTCELSYCVAHEHCRWRAICSR